jgi:CubicO group peptidase (beta-lactamase class C family)
MTLSRRLITLVLCIWLAACSPPVRAPTLPAPPPAQEAAPAQVAEYWPTAGWQTSTPEAQGMDAGKLEAMFQAIDEQDINLHSVLIVRHGYLVAEVYYPPHGPDTAHVQYSVTKSVVSALLGIAIQEDYVESIDQPALSYFGDWSVDTGDPRKGAMTLEHLITMTSGMEWDDDRDIDGLWRSRDWVQHMLDRPMADPPGTQFSYNSGSTHLLSAVIQLTTGQTAQAYAQEHLFGPLGMRPGDTRWETDRGGFSIGGWGLYMTPRDMAKLGYLYLKEGIWDGQSIVPAAWVRASVEPRVAVDDAQEPWGLHYGYGWWVHELGAYAAHGRAGQFIFVLPDLDMLVVFTSELEGADFVQPELLLRDYIIPAATGS